MLKVTGSISGRGCIDLFCARGPQGVRSRPSTAPGVSTNGVLNHCMIEVYLGYRNINEIKKCLKKKINQSDSTLSTPRPGAVEGIGTAHEGAGNGQSIRSTVSDAKLLVVDSNY